MSDVSNFYNFIGEYAHNIDKKGRIIIPARFRDAFEGHLIVAKGLDGCLNLYTLSQWNTLMQRLMSLPNTKKEARLYRRKLAAKASECEIDAQGRILIPASLMKEASLVKECYVIGTGNTVEIWSKENWMAYNEEHSDDFEEVAEALTEFFDLGAYMMEHYSVLLEECIQYLNIDKNGIYVDGTLGRAGHSSEILKRLEGGHLYSFDKDKQAIDKCTPILSAISDDFTLIHGDFSTMREELEKRNIQGIDGLLLDLGVSSPQFDEAARGFSYRFDAKLDMRMDQSQPLSAYEVVNEYSYEDLVRIFFRYGEEKFSKQIARKIEKVRAEKPIETTFELVDVIKSCLPAKVLNSKGHPAKKIFQAIRIEVNNELQSLKYVLDTMIPFLNVGGRICVISFHSLEDRMVKESFNAYCKEEKVDKRIPILASEIQSKPYRLVERKPILASTKELEENKRSHSAKLRVIERVR